MDFARTAAREFEFLSNAFGQPESARMNIVELPDDSVSAAWGPEVIAIGGRRIADRNSQRLLANTLAVFPHQLVDHLIGRCEQAALHSSDDGIFHVF